MKKVGTYIAQSLQCGVVMGAQARVKQNTCVPCYDKKKQSDYEYLTSCRYVSHAYKQK